MEGESPKSGKTRTAKQRTIDTAEGMNVDIPTQGKGDEYFEISGARIGALERKLRGRAGKRGKA